MHAGIHGRVRRGTVSGNAAKENHTHRLHSSSFLGLPCRNPEKELLWSLQVMAVIQ